MDAAQSLLFQDPPLSSQQDVAKSDGRVISICGVTLWVGCEGFGGLGKGRAGRGDGGRRTHHGLLATDKKMAAFPW